MQNIDEEIELLFAELYDSNQFSRGELGLNFLKVREDYNWDDQWADAFDPNLIATEDDRRTKAMD